jgi:hypothetical protein
VSNTHEVMTALIARYLQKCCCGVFPCNLIDIFFLTASQPAVTGHDYLEIEQCAAISREETRLSLV